MNTLVIGSLDRKEAANVKSKTTYSQVMSFIKYHIGYTPTSRRCLEYQEALFIASGHTNYVEVCD